MCQQPFLTLARPGKAGGLYDIPFAGSLLGNLMSAAVRMLEISDLLARRGPIGLREIARDLGIPTGSTHRLLHELEQERVVERSESGEWSLSFRLLQLAGVQLSRLRLPALVRPFLEQVAADTRETAFFAVPSGDEIVYLDMVRTDMQVQMNVDLGTRRPMYCTGLGKAILAHLAPSQQKRVLSRGTMPAYTPQTITDPLLLERELANVRLNGFATDREEIIPGVHCIAVPLLNHANRAAGAISIAGASTNQEGERFETIKSLLLDIGAEISMRLGYVGDIPPPGG